MGRSIHHTRHDLEELDKFDFSDKRLKASQVKYLSEQLDKKRLIKEQVKFT